MVLQILDELGVQAGHSVIGGVELLLGEYAGLNGFRNVREYAEEPRDHQDRHNDHNHIVPDAVVLSPIPLDEPWDQETGADIGNVDYEPVVFHRRLHAHEQLRLLAHIPAVLGWFQVIAATNIDERVGVSSNSVKEFGQRVAAVRTEVTRLVAKSTRVASQQLKQQQGDLEEGVQERAKHHAAPVLAHQSIEGPIASIDRPLKVPVHHASWHAEVEGISEKLHTPNKLKNVENSPYSRVVGIIDILAGAETGWKAAVLPYAQSRQSNSKQQENGHVNEDVHVLVQVWCSMVYKNGVQFDFVRVHADHHNHDER